MIETNIRILKPGIDLYLNARQAMLVAQDLSPDLVGKTCNALRYHNGLAAAPSFTPGEILVAAQGPLETLVAKGDDWRVEVQDGGETRRLLFSEPSHRSVLVRLVERLLLMEIQCRMDLWRLPDSLRIWYEPEPFLPRGDLAAYRRFEVLAVPIASVGIGIVVDVSTAFFTVLSIADFFREDLPKGDQKDRQERFRHLSQRQKERKGTLLYELARNRRKKCYFVEFQHGVTCATTSSFALDGHDYPSLFAYYREVHPYLDVKPSDPVAKVSFSNIGRPVPVAANKLRLRVMNDSLPEELKQVDKIEPSERVRLIESFWSRLGDYPLGPGRPGVERRFWQPGAEHAVQLRQPGLVFPNEIIPAPATTDLGEHKRYYSQRRHWLRELGCWEVPAALDRLVYYVMPISVDEEMATQLVDDVTQHLSQWTRRNMEAQPVTYADLDDAIAQLRKKRPGIAVFVFNDEDPTTYFQISHELKEWRVKHVTYGVFQTKYSGFKATQGMSPSNDGRIPRGIRDWQSFAEMTALDVLQQLGCVPWVVTSTLQYEARLAVDVGEDRRHFSLSFLICRPKARHPSFWLDTILEVKSDPKTEMINPRQLYEKIVALFKRVPLSRYVPLSSLLVERDGRECGDELKAIETAKSELIKLGYLETGVQLDVVDVHKRSVKNVRIWDRDENGSVWHAPEGTAVFLDKRTAVLANTGAATLHQGTAEPIMLVARGDHADMISIATAVHATTHLNWSSPGAAQRLPLELKRTDEALQKRAAQEIRLYK